MMGRWFLVVFGAILAGMGGVFCVILWAGYLRAAETRAWVPAEAAVTAAWIEETELSDARDPRYRLGIRYRYRTSDGQEWTGERIRRNDRPTRYRRRKEALLERYAPGTRVTAWVDPANPARAVLEHDARAPGYTLWFPALFVVGGAGIVFGAFRKRAPHGSPGAPSP